MVDGDVEDGTFAAWLVSAGFFLMPEGKDIDCVLGWLMAIERYIAGIAERNQQLT